MGEILRHLRAAPRGDKGAPARGAPRLPPAGKRGGEVGRVGLLGRRPPPLPALPTLRGDAAALLLFRGSAGGRGTTDTPAAPSLGVVVVVAVVPSEG